jgi:hypothetical protein
MAAAISPTAGAPVNQNFSGIAMLVRHEHDQKSVFA